MTTRLIRINECRQFCIAAYNRPDLPTHGHARLVPAGAGERRSRRIIAAEGGNG